MGQGYIKLHRAIRDCWIWNESEPFDKRSAWLDMLLMANHADAKIMIDGKLMEIHAGQFHTSILKLSERWKWDRKKTTRFMGVLESDQMITTNRTSKGTTVTIVNWGKYQIEGTTDGTQNGQQTGQQWDNRRDTNKNVKECIKNEKNNNKVAKRYVEDESLNDSIKDFIDHRKKLRKPMTDRAIELFIKKLESLAPGDIGEQINLINVAIEKGWQSVYPIKEKVMEIKKENSKLKMLEDMYLEEE